jgi:hypothetical protein
LKITILTLRIAEVPGSRIFWQAKCRVAKWLQITGAPVLESLFVPYGETNPFTYPGIQLAAPQAAPGAGRLDVWR